MIGRLRFLAVLAALALAACGSGDPARRLLDSAGPDDWPGYGRTYGQQHYSPLDEVSAENIPGLGLAWAMDLPPGNSVTEPLAVDGVLYFATGLSVVHAVDAVTGKELWQYDPRAAEKAGLNLRVGWGVRGIAWWNGKIYAGTQDGRLIAIDARTGKLVWEAMTIRPEDPAQVNGAPRVFDGRVIIGFASTTGAIRGYVTAYDAESGKQLWRFYTVPGQPGVDKDETTQIAAKTWSGEWWKYGGEASVWNSLAYDPETETVFIGTGSPYPWNHRIRSEGKGDNLFVASIVALDGRTGKYKWHYQTVPGDTWDYDAIMDIELADLTIDGKPRKVLMQAPKNGFFYVIDRTNGKLISAEPYTKVTWASHVDLATGRPVEAPGARFLDGKPKLLAPTSNGGHNWMAMASSPQTGLVYIPEIEFEAYFQDISYDWKPSPGDRTVDGGVLIMGGPAFGTKPAKGNLLAWNPVTQKPAWKLPRPTFLNGGVLATGGKLVFQGTVEGLFKAYHAENGKELWSFDARTPILAAPITYRAGGKQYVTLLTGMSMGIAMYAPTMVGPETIERYNIDPMAQQRRVLTFAIGGKGTLPPRREPAPPPPDPTFRLDAARKAAGFMPYQMHCLSCHGDQAIGIGQGPDLRRSAVPQDAVAFAQVVRDGALEARGMPKFAEFTDQKLEAIRYYVRARSADLRSGAGGGTVGVSAGSGGGRAGSSKIGP